ncbi:P-type ATPase [Trema orientale]|uniref:Calcium-transporting ATPase n=1 Tax=Trema orientale TaxID=63057 RepID=A0A2P5FWA1_TREOI|nr:P-type ATPase [Trema orientale]
MSTSSNREPESSELLNHQRSPATASKNAKKYWRFAFSASIFNYRALQSIRSSSNSYRSVLNVEPETSEVEIDQAKLSQLVEEKDYVLLEKLGGVDGIAAALKTSLEHGIHDEVVEDVACRRKAFGTNTAQNPPKKRLFFHFVWRALLDLNIFILIICGSVYLGLGIKVEGLKEGWNDGGSVLIGVFIAVFVVAITDYWHNSIIEKLQKDSNNIQVDVVRGGHRKQVPISEILVGDVVYLKAGGKVPAHGLVLEAHSLKLQADKASWRRDQVDNIVELNPTNKNSFLFFGTKVVDGFTWMLVTSVGMNARSQMTSRISHDSMKLTPLQARLEELDSTTDVAGFLVVLIVLLLILIADVSFTFTDKDGEEKPATGLTKIYVIVGIVVGLITTVVNAPDPWRLSLMLTRAYAMKKLKADNVMVRDLSALETIGFATTLCINKTQTVTKNQMKVTELWLGKDIVAQGTYSSISPKVTKLLHEGIALNTTGGVCVDQSSKSPIEKAILSWAVEDLNMDMEEIKRCDHDILDIEAFSSEMKHSGILIKKKANKTIHVHLKGAAELILTMCSSYYDALGNVEDLDHNQKTKFEETIRDMANRSHRCIAFAHKESVEAKEIQSGIKVEILKDGMTLLGIVGISDPCHPEVKDAVSCLQNAGVKVKMFTDENILTAKAIATECGLLTPNSGAAIEDVEFQNYTQEERMKKVDEICVMARSSPSHKLLMIQCLRRKSHVVAIVGNDSNDSSIMKEAGIGLYMGIQGIEVTEDNSDIVLADGSFASVAEVLRWGRCVYSSIQKFIQFQVTATLAALIANLIGIFSADTLPLTAVQLMWVSLITDTLACFAFATEKPTKELMKKPPVSMMDPLLSNIMLRNILPQALYQIALLLTIQITGTSVFGMDSNVTVTFIFTSYVFCQVFNQVNSRKLATKNVFEKIHENKLFLVISVVIIVLQILFVEILQIFADTESLNWPQWGSCVGIASLTLPIGWISRLIPVPNKQVGSYLMVGKTIRRFILRKFASLLTWASHVLLAMQRNQGQTAHNQIELQEIQTA